MCAAVVARLLILENRDPDAPVTVYINSPGGSADSGFAMYDMLRFVSCPIRTVVAGLCASAAVMVFLGGDRGHRFSLRDPAAIEVTRYGDREAGRPGPVRPADIDTDQPERTHP